MPVVINLGCDAFEATPNATGSLEVLTGATVVVTLCSNPTTGFSWSAPATSDAAVATVSGWTEVGPTSDAPGAPGSVQVSIDAVAAGATTISASYDQPWEGGQKGAWTAELALTVRDGVEVEIGCDAFGEQANAVQAVGIAAGQAVVLHLCSNPTTGFSWSDAVSSDPAVVSVGASSFLAPAPGMMGAPGAEHIVLVGEAAGSATVTASYDQPWDGGTKGAWTVELTVTVS